MKNIYSMTGSANKLLNSDVATINVDISSVNNRFLEIFLKLPDCFRHLDSKLRSICQEKMSRGKLDCFINISMNFSSSLNISEPAIQSLTDAISTIKNYLPQASISALDVLNYPGIIKQPENIQDLLDEKLIETFSNALDTLVENRKNEGTKLQTVLLSKLDLIEKQADIIQTQLDELVQNQRNKITEKIKALNIEVDSSRIEQEVALAAQKADVVEEYDRLRAHIKEVRTILSNGGTCGKRLDFMMQEFNRESNTLASKASNLEMTQVAVELKVLIEQMREQVQNIE